jgi:hypothetical protein
LILGGVAMRLLQYPAAFHARLYEVGSWMGVLVVAALVLFAFNLVKTMKSSISPPAPAAAAKPAAPAFVSTLPAR